MKIDYLKLAGIIIGASAFWKVIEAILHFGLQRRLKNAQLRNIIAETNEKIIGNWISWGDKMEVRILELEKRIRKCIPELCNKGNVSMIWKFTSRN